MLFLFLRNTLKHVRLEVRETCKNFNCVEFLSSFVSHAIDLMCVHRFGTPWWECCSYPKSRNVRALPMKRMQSSAITETYRCCPWNEFPGSKWSCNVLPTLRSLKERPPTFLQIVSTGAWFQDFMKDMRRVKTEAVDRAQRLSRGENILVFLWRWLTVATLAKLREKKSTGQQGLGMVYRGVVSAPESLEHCCAVFFFHVGSPRQWDPRLEGVRVYSHVVWCMKVMWKSYVVGY